MNWREIAKEDLKQFSLMKAGRDHNNERIKDLDERIARLAEKPTRVSEDKILDCKSKREKLQLNNNAVERLLNSITESLELLTPTERLVLTRMYISNEKGALNQLCGELNYEKSRIYQIKNEALRKFAVAMYAVEAL